MIEELTEEQIRAALDELRREEAAWKEALRRRRFMDDQADRTKAGERLIIRVTRVTHSTFESETTLVVHSTD